MAYSDFTLRKACTDFSLTINGVVDLFADVEAITPSEHLALTLRENIPVAIAVNTEKAKSEMIIAPVLFEVRRQLQYQIALFSGVDFTVNPELGLNGLCDFILSQSPGQYLIGKPVVAIVEAKNDNIGAGLGQCAAEMVAAQMFNERESNEAKAVYGAVTTGEVWRFLKLEGVTLFIAPSARYINQIDVVLGILVSLCL